MRPTTAVRRMEHSPNSSSTQSRSIGDESNCVDLDQGSLEKARDLHSRTRWQVRAKTLAAYAAVLGVFVQARQPRCNANDVLERAPDGAKRRL